MECKKCKKGLFLQSADGQIIVDIEKGQARLVCHDTYNEVEDYIMDKQKINFCPMCGVKLEED